MADDAIGHLGLDTKDIDAAVERVIAKLEKLNKVVVSTDGSTKKMGATMKALYQLGGAIGIPLAIGSLVNSLKRLGTMALETGERIEASRDKFEAGGSRLSARVGNAESPEAEALTTRMDDQLERIKNETGTALAKTMASVNTLSKLNTDQWAKAGLLLKGVFTGKLFSAEGRAEMKKTATSNPRFEAEITKQAEDLDDAQRAITARETLREIEFSIAEIRAEGTNEEADRVKIQELELARSRQQLELASNRLIQDRKGQIEARNRIGELTVSNNLAATARKVGLSDAAKKTEALRLEQKGMEAIARIVETIATYEERIATAQAQGKPELVQQLQLQKQLEVNAKRVAERNLTSKQIRDERTTGRKFAADKIKTDAQDLDMEKRLAQAERQGNTLPPGSRLARYAAAKDAGKRIAEVANAPLNVPSITASIINALELKIGNIGKDGG